MSAPTTSRAGVEEHVAAVVAAAPAPTPEQIVTLQGLLGPAPMPSPIASRRPRTATPITEARRAAA